MKPVQSGLTRNTNLLLLGCATLFFCNLSGSMAGENGKTKHSAAPTTTEHLNSYEQALDNNIAFITQSSNAMQRRKLAATARTYLPSIADPDARLLWDAAIMAAARDYETAAVLLSHVKNFDHGCALTLELAAKTNSVLLRTNKAIELCTLALKKQTKESIMTLRAGSYQAEKKYAEAAKDYVDAAHLGYAALNYCRAATCFLRNDEPAKALAYIDKSIQGANKTELPICYNTQAVCFEKLNRPEDAVHALTNALAAYETQAKNGHQSAEQPMFTAACLNERAKCYDKMGKKAEAEKDRQRSSAFAKNVESELFGR